GVRRLPGARRWPTQQHSSKCACSHKIPFRQHAAEPRGMQEALNLVTVPSRGTLCCVAAMICDGLTRRQRGRTVMSLSTAVAVPRTRLPLADYAAGVAAADELLLAARASVRPRVGDAKDDAHQAT